MILEYMKGGDFNGWIDNNHKKFNWNHKITTLSNVLYGLKEIHQKNLVHRDFHTGNILVKFIGFPCISGMGLCGEIDNKNETKIYGVMPYVAPEVLRENLILKQQIYIVLV